MDKNPGCLPANRQLAGQFTPKPKEPKGTAQEYLAEIGLMGGYDAAFDDEVLQVDPANFELSAEMLSAVYDLFHAYSVVRQQIAEFEQVVRSEGLDLDSMVVTQDYE